MLKKLLAILLLSLICQNSHADFGVDTYGLHNTYPDNPLVKSITIGNNSNRVLIVQVHAIYNYVSATYNGASLSAISASGQDALLYILNPDVGTHDLSVYCGPHQIGVYWVSVYGLKQQAPNSYTFTPNGSETTTPGASITTTVSNTIVIDIIDTSPSGSYGLEPVDYTNRVHVAGNSSSPRWGISTMPLPSATTQLMDWVNGYPNTWRQGLSAWEVYSGGATYYPFKQFNHGILTGVYE